MRSCLYDGFLRNSQLDSLQRLENWVRDRLAYLDRQYALQDIPNIISSPSYPDTDEIVQINYYTLSGIPTVNPSKGGFYIKMVRYRNGRIEKSKVFMK